MKMNIIMKHGKRKCKIRCRTGGDICNRHRWIDWCSVIMLIISAKEI